MARSYTSLPKIWSKDNAAMKASKSQSCLPWANDVRPGRMLLIAAVPLCVVAFFSYLARNYQMDDALIYLRYVRNFHEGFGLVYNPGEKFNGLTSPLFTYVSLAASFLSGNLQLVTTVISAFFLTCAAILGGIVFSNGKWETLFTAVVIGSFGYFYHTFGMETPLFVMLIGLSLYLYKFNSRYFVIALALLTITRFEGGYWPW
jgi:arabinofuranosyltransferase